MQLMREQEDADGSKLAPDDPGGLEPVADARWQHADVDDRDGRVR
jgi:hypothetical protein